MTVFFHGYEVGLYYLDETTEGTPEVGEYAALAQKSEFKLADTPNPNAVKKSGSVDNASIEAGIAKPVASVTLNPDDLGGLAFLKSRLSTDTPFTLIAKVGSTLIAVMSGCKTKRFAGNVTIFPQHSVLESTMEFDVFNITYTEPIGATFVEADDSAINWNDITIKKDSAVLTDWWDFEWSIENEIERSLDDNGNTKSLKRGPRVVTGSYTRSSTDSQIGDTEFNEAAAGTAKLVEFLIGSDTWQFTASVLNDVDITHPLTGMAGVKQAFTATTYVEPTP